ncbi:MAG TPA: hypothetical protein VNF91_10800, partial [Candidatus Acidoferrum sp.]|nr:hypothetical protein [Candidatus Acidoferrum sp.]
MNPPLQDGGHAGSGRETACDVSEDGLIDLAIGCAYSALEHSAFGFVESATDGCAEVDCVGRGGTYPALVAAIRGS